MRHPAPARPPARLAMAATLLCSFSIQHALADAKAEVGPPAPSTASQPLAGADTPTAGARRRATDMATPAWLVLQNAINLRPAAAFEFACSEAACSFDGSVSQDRDGTITAYNWTFGDGTAASGIQVAHAYAAGGKYAVTLTVIDDRGGHDIFSRSVVVTDPPVVEGCAQISLLPCAQVRIRGDRALAFDGSDGGLPDGNGVPTGFTMVDPPTATANPAPHPDAPGLWPEKLTVDWLEGVLRIEATPGIQHVDNNDLVNALGVGLNVPSATVSARVTLIELPPPNGGWAQAGLWFGAADQFGRGTVEDDYIKLVVASPAPGQYILETAHEQDGERISSKDIPLPPDIETITLTVRAEPGSRSLQTRYDLGGGDQILKTFVDLPDHWFSFDQAGIDPGVATRSFGGIFATQRNASVPETFAFRDFSLSEPIGGGVSSLAFDRWTFPAVAPTAMAWAPDGRLYVTELFGRVHAFTLDHESRVVANEETIDSVRSSHGGSNRLTLGLAVDPASTPDDVVLWVAHSDGSINNGVVNSGVVSRLSGPGFATVENRITGLPRAIANHAINSIHFGPDGRLYIAAGGNTGAGAANLEPTEFGDRPEQPLSAAILAADVNAPGFSGACATPIGMFGIPSTCDVIVHASGLRNSYDFTFDVNGTMFATDNGLGIAGTVPPSASPPCTGYGDPALHDPGSQPDTLLRIEAGRYYGHPNPYRDECVFKDGTFQGVAPLPSYQPPLFTLGANLSANAIIEYRGDSFFSKLLGELLITNFSVGDNVTRTRLSDAGTSVTDHGILLSGYSDPLPLTQDDAGRLYVGEFNAHQIAVEVPLPLDPAPEGAWTARQPLPEAVLDAGGVGVDGRLYMVGGKTDAGHLSTLRIYDPVTDGWTQGPDLPGAAVENPAVAALGRSVYVFGGSTQPFSGAVTNAARYDIDGGTWTVLAPMTTARGGATAQALGGRLYLVGGMSADGASLDSVEIYDPATDTWTSAPAMLTRRDNPGSAVLDGRLHVFGGRTRNADGNTVDGTLSTMEIFDPQTDAWTFGASMLAGRRAMVVGTISGRAQVAGGESPIVPEVEEYDPQTDTWRLLTPMATPRHGAAGATLRGGLYVAGGGPQGGSSYTPVNEVFRY